MASANKIIFQKSLKELRIILCQKSKSSQGVREFVEKYYVPLKLANPNFPILIRECNNIQPTIYARYEFGKELNVPVANESADIILKHVSDFNKKA
ncbi:hypothetical protein PGB90_005628 [Kerria lacca]